MSQDPFASAGSTGVKITDYEGRLLLVTPNEYIQGLKTDYDEDKDAVDADVVVLDGEGAPEELDDVRIFQGKLIGSLKHRIGKKQNMVLGRLGKDSPKKKGQSAAWTFETPTDDDKKLAREYLAQQPADPFAA